MQHSPDARSEHVTTAFLTKRRRNNWALWRKVGEPLTSLYGGPHDAYLTGTYLPDEVWLAALDEVGRRTDLYYDMVPFAKWGVS